MQEDHAWVHIFGNSLSPVVTIYYLWQATWEGETNFGADTKYFVERHFCIDDGLISLPTASAAIDRLKHTCASLTESNLKLHKIASNSFLVMQAYTQCGVLSVCNSIFNLLYNPSRKQLKKKKT